MQRFIVIKGTLLNSEIAIIFLFNPKTKDEFPIFIGKTEYQSIVLAISKVETPRPLIHDLVLSVLEELGGRLTKVVIDGLESGVYFSRLYIDDGEIEFSIDTRPSDAIALAVKKGIPIFIEESVIEQIKNTLSDLKRGEKISQQKSFSKSEAEEIKKQLESVKPEDFFQ